MRVWLLSVGGLLFAYALIFPLLRGRRPHWISAGLLGLLLLPGLGFEISWQYAQHTGSSLVTSVSGKPAGYLHCERLSETLFNASSRSGEVRSDQPDKAFITWSTCNDFRGFLLSDKRAPSIEQITAVHVIDHEAIHVSGDYNEARTECRSMALDSAVLQRLGMSAQGAAAAVQRYRTEIYPRLSGAYLMDCSTLQLRSTL